MKIEMLTVGPVETNCYFLVNEDTKKILVVDPGDKGKALAERIKEEGYECEGILITHGHGDHVHGLAELLNNLSNKPVVYACEHEKDVLERPELNLANNVLGYDETYSANVYLKDNEELELCGFKFRVLWTPGHTAGGCCYYFYEDEVLFSGDTLFCMSIGRTDFPTGDMKTLVSSIKEKLLVLPEDTQVFCGHEEPTTIGREKTSNMFVQ